MADYALPCPVCNGGMYDQLAPTNKYPYKPGTPIAVCKRKKEGCPGVIWAPKGMPVPIPGAPQYAPTAPKAAPVQTRATFEPQAVETYAELCVKHATRLVDLLTTTTELYTARVAKMPDGVAKEILSAASAEDMEKLAVTIYIELQKKGH